jgi:acyl-CoA synthetase (AMP-forming)/AMP-acid ligase II
VSLYCIRRGLILVPLNPRSSRFENNTILNDCNATAVVFNSSLTNKISDMKKDVINRVGYNVYSSEIENLISLQNGVIEAAVTPHSDDVLGEKIHVVIFKNDSLLVDQLKLICKTKLAE